MTAQASSGEKFGKGAEKKSMKSFNFQGGRPGNSLKNTSLVNQRLFKADVVLLTLVLSKIHVGTDLDLQVLVVFLYDAVGRFRVCLYNL